ncbi:hypothetical protein HPULCUR_009281 [Helicostylum pulchrum]|uniref:Uncharacterized protein n=1 Tax=Helicostylum pulchrum TaxID=562976 RepID=A0ABP9YA24_9FUNG
MRKEVPRSNKSVLERGIDTWMKKTDTPMDIWKDISGGTQLPHVLKIKLTDALTKRPGYLYVFDLLHPRFLPPTLETKRGAECPKMHKVETLMALDFIAKMKCIKSKSLPNDVVLKVCDIEAMADNERKYKESQVTIQEMKIYINDILVEKSAREAYIAAVDATNRMIQMKTFAYQRLANLKQEKMKETEAVEKLQYENSNLVTKIGLLEDELSREYAIAIKEKNDLRAYLKMLRDSVDNRDRVDNIK